MAARDETIFRWTTEPRRIAPEAVAEAILVAYSASDTVGFAIADAKTDELVGNLAVRLDGAVATLGYWVAAAGRGRGAATEALRLATAWLFAEGLAATAELEIHPANTASRRVAEKSGFSEAGTRDSDAPCGADGTVVVYRAVAPPPPPGNAPTPESADVRAWELLDTRPGSAGHLQLAVHTYRLPDGSLAEWDIHGGGRTVAVLALTEDHEVVLARQFRPGPGVVLDELPGGRIEEGEDVLEAAERELLEETGYAGEAQLAGMTWQSASSATRRYVAVVRGARAVAPPRPEPGEFSQPVLADMETFRDHLRGGQLTDVDLGYLALDYLGCLAPPPP